jgi:hypothetical protein
LCSSQKSSKTPRSVCVENSRSPMLRWRIKRPRDIVDSEQFNAAAASSSSRLEGARRLGWVGSVFPHSLARICPTSAGCPRHRHHHVIGRDPQLQPHFLRVHSDIGYMEQCDMPHHAPTTALHLMLPLSRLPRVDCLRLTIRRASALICGS